MRKLILFMLISLPVAAETIGRKPMDSEQAPKTQTEPDENEFHLIKDPTWRKVLQGATTVLGGMGRRNQINCTSQVVGNTVYTSCDR